ncbi:unnamed protein product [Medioppia subpectinata]|uniref:Glycosyltransferase 2-like domain-containing protein n=1 Tax=Medioppia subpectinata TaxID=1979941 RepID=A0A7R9Q763_9ACAR|nr:unnamed protein product [Medioppia subpectinata]CAG2114474.1 unnamed protein product [Medioppia subpectinata]
MLSLSAGDKHILHCILLVSVIVVFEYLSGGLKLWYTDTDSAPIDPFVAYGWWTAAGLYLLRVLALLSLPQVLCNFLGLTLYNAFNSKVTLRGTPLLAPFICIRTVTRGDYPDLIHNNVSRNLQTCLSVGLENFIIEVVTDRAIGLVKHPRIREVVVPTSYKTKSGALYKARALQYCLEDENNILGDNDWVVHLDEETIMTENAIRGILNFVFNNKHEFGQGLITYANEEVVNWWTTLADSFRVADDMGKLRFQFYMFHRPLFSWKGSYVVTKLSAERSVSFDHGLDGSVAEDCYFSMIAYKNGYTFDFIEGEMWEKSPFTITDFLQQRKRWMQGIFLVVHSRAIPIQNKVFLALSLYAWLTMPLSTSNLVFASLYPLPSTSWCNFLSTFVGAVSIYMYLFGVMKSFSLSRIGVRRYLLCLLGAIFTIPFNIVIENIAVLWGFLGKKHKFYIVQKQVLPTYNI